MNYVLLLILMILLTSNLYTQEQAVRSKKHYNTIRIIESDPKQVEKKSDAKAKASVIDKAQNKAANTTQKLTPAQSETDESSEPQSTQVNEPEKSTAESKNIEPATKKKKQVEVPTPLSGDAVMLQTGISLYSNGDYQSAAEKLEEMRGTFPGSRLNDQASIWIAKSYQKLGRPEEAARSLETVRNTSGEYPAALFQLGRIYLSMKEYDQAKESYFQATSLFPGHDLADDSLLELAQIYMREGQGEEALKIAVRVTRNYPDRDTADDAFYLMGKIYEKDPKLKDIERAREVYKAFLKKAASKNQVFENSPLLEKVKSDLAYIEANYFSSY